ncbi:MAG: cyclic nucleotide-binding domain-containing protein [Verrucomicrobiota bacterium]|nr:cyclic nucleotide-binding domain-containing protein [Verrucomicrobiota bacterium]
MASEDNCGYKIWAIDNVVYGPVELPILVSWVKEERVTSETWIYSEAQNRWSPAGQLPELAMFFKGKSSLHPVMSDTQLYQKGFGDLRPGALRRVKIFAGMNDDQLLRFMQFMELRKVPQWTEVVKQGDPGDAMYLVLEGELRVRMLITGKETILAILQSGEFFGEIALFDHGPRSADVIANENSSLLKISVSNFQRLVNEAPELAAPFLLGIGKTLTGRIRADNKRFKDSVSFARAAGA